MNRITAFLHSRLRFDRNELSGAFGDIGTSLPLIIGIIMASGMDGAAVFITFGLMQILTALVYGIPMPVQPLKAAALLVITMKLSGPVLTGGGLAIGIIMLLLAFSGVIDYLGGIIPKPVIRGVQMGLGLQLAMLALGQYIPSDSFPGFIIAGAAFIITLALMGNRRFPPALAVVLMGAVYGILFNYKPGMFSGTQGFALPALSVPSWADMVTGFLLLAIPQIPLSLGNSIYASSQMIHDYFPEKNVPPRKIAFTYSLMNIISPLLGGIPVCHGSGGMAGHYAFGARTGGSIVIHGSMYLAVGLLFGAQGSGLLAVFPKPVLGVILLFEGIALLNLVRDMTVGRNDFLITVIVGLCSISLPYGYLVGMASGMIMHYAFRRKPIGMPAPVYMEDTK